MASHDRKNASSVLLRIVLLAVISLTLGASVYSWNAKTLTGNQMPMPFGYGLSVVLSGSMEPALSVDDLVIVRESASYAPGEIVVYQSGDILVIHRIVDIDGDTLITRGDANSIADDPVSISAVKGKLVGVIPRVGTAVRFLKSPVGIVLLLGAAGVLLELSWRREKRQDSEELEAIRREIEKLRGEDEKDADRKE